jgi:hypothetical protein
MLKFVSKFALDILPSVVATIIGAYIVNHYIVARPGANAPVAAAVSTTEPKAEAKVVPEAATADAKASETLSGVANIPEPGVKAKGIAEKAIIEKTATEKPAEKSADKPAETASIPVDTRRHPREKAVAKAAPVPVQPSVPVVAAPTTAPPAPPVEAAIAPEERRDANELARAAIERLRGAGEGSSRSQEAARTPDAPRVPDAARVPDPSRVVSAPPVRPLPPPIMVSTPGPETFDAASGSSQIKPPDAAGRHSGGSLAAARPACRGGGAAGAGPHHGCRRHAVGCEICVSRGIAEIARNASQPSSIPAKWNPVCR